jgi:hypothetical protein
MKKMKTGFVVCNYEDGQATTVETITGKARSGDSFAILQYCIKKYPFLSEQLKCLVSSNITFFYDPFYDTVRIVANPVDNDTLFEYINVYYSLVNKTDKLEKFCKDKKISFTPLPKTKNSIVIYIADFLTENEYDVKNIV